MSSGQVSLGGMMAAHDRTREGEKGCERFSQPSMRSAEEPERLGGEERKVGRQSTAFIPRLLFQHLGKSGDLRTPTGLSEPGPACGAPLSRANRFELAPFAQAVLRNVRGRSLSLRMLGKLARL